jgi:hypothetical protein
MHEPKRGGDHRLPGCGQPLLQGHIGRHTMQRSITISIVAVATVAAAAAVWFWALRPLGFFSYLTSTVATDADIIRQYWPHRLVQPEWVSDTPDRLMKWHFVETVARLAVVALLWFIVVGGFTFRFLRGRKLWSNPY